MLITSIEIYNFRQFYGNQRLNFSLDPEKNVTLIHAENGTGKTAFLNAILWCLFGETTKNFEKPKHLLNNTAKSEDNHSFHVFLNFTQDGSEYSVQRGMTKLTGSYFRVFKIDSAGSYVEIESPDLFINSIVPRDMAGYFFFQGEGIGQLSGTTGGQVKEAIRDILGFGVAEQVLKDFNAIRADFRRELKRVDKSGELDQIESELMAAEKTIENCKEDLQKAESNKRDFQERLTKVDADLRGSNVEVVAQKQRQRDDLNKGLVRYKSDKERALARRARLIGKYAVSAFAAPMVKKGIDFIDEKELRGTIPAPYNEQLVQDILNSAVCICGAEVKLGTDAYGRIQKMLAKAADPHILNRVRRARSQLTVIRGDRKRAKEEITTALKDVATAENRVEQVSVQLKEVSAALKNVDIDSIRELEEKRARISRQLTEAISTSGAEQQRLNTATESLQRLRAKEKSMRSSQPEVQKYRRYISFINDIESELLAVLEESEASAVSILNAKINEFFDLYVRQDYKASITSDFEITMVDRNRQVVAKSDGQALLMSLTFISSLIALAKARLNASGEILTPGAIAPFVIDAPFGVLDNKYKGNVAGEIPKAVSQVVFLLSSSHWEGSVEKAIRGLVGAEYNMVLEVASEKKSDAIHNIQVLGNELETVRYNADIDRTVIEEVGSYV